MMPSLFLYFFVENQAILNQVLEKHRAGIVVKQVAAGREFSGCPFYSKPDVIHFKVYLSYEQLKDINSEPAEFLNSPLSSFWIL